MICLGKFVRRKEQGSILIIYLDKSIVKIFISYLARPISFEIGKSCKTAPRNKKFHLQAAGVCRYIWKHQDSVHTIKFLIIPLLQSLLKTADQLKIKGLCEVSDDKENNSAKGRESPGISPRPLPKFRRLLNKRPRSSENIRKPFKKDYADRAAQESIYIDDKLDEDNDMPVVVEERAGRSLKSNGQAKMTGHGLLPTQVITLSQL